MDWCCWENEMVISKDKWIFIFNVNLCVCIYNEKFNVRECFICTKHKNSYVIRWCWSLISYLPSVWLFVFLLWIATSKIDNFTVTDGTVSFGFQGEALGSISDVSLLEIVTKARGRPNGYRKVMKVKWFCHRCLTYDELIFVRIPLQLSTFHSCLGMQVFASWNQWWETGCRHYR